MIRERVIDAMQGSRREELNAMNANIARLELQRKYLELQLVKAKGARHDLLKTINAGVTDDQLVEVLTGVVVGEGVRLHADQFSVMADDSPEWMKDESLSPETF